MELTTRNPEGYMDLTAYKAIGKAEPRQHTYRPLIYVCSPSTERAKDYSRYVMEKGGFPMAPGLYLPQFLREGDEEIDLAQFFALVLLSKCPELWVFGDAITEGMRREIRYAQRKGKIVKFVGEEELR